jgi:hypothetical protein
MLRSSRLASGAGRGNAVWALRNRCIVRWPSFHPHVYSRRGLGTPAGRPGHAEAERRSDVRAARARWAERCTGFDRSGVRSSLRVRWAGGCTSCSGGWRWRCSSGASCWSPPARTAGTRRPTPAALHALGVSSSATPRRAAALHATNPTRSSCTSADVGAKAPHCVGAAAAAARGRDQRRRVRRRRRATSTPWPTSKIWTSLKPDPQAAFD